MFAKLSTALLALPLLAVATPWGSPTTTSPVTTTVTVTATATPTSVSQCTTGSVQCCNSVESASDPAASLLLGLLGVVVQGVDVLVGITCTPIDVIGVGSDSWYEINTARIPFSY